MQHNGNNLWGISSLRVNSSSESYPIAGLPRGLQYPYYRGAKQADVCYYTDLEVELGVKKGMYHGVQ